MPGLNYPSLAGTWWLLDGYGDPAALTAVISGSRITLRWNEDADAVSGSAGCNLYGGKSLIRDGMMTIKDINQTAMACLTPGVMEQESRYLDLLGKAQSWRVEGGKLTVTCGGGEVLVFSKDASAPRPLNSLASTKWELSSFGTGDAVSSLISGTKISLSFNEDATRVSGTAGCNTYGGAARVTGGEIKIWDVFSTKMFCNDPPGLMAQEGRYLELLGKALSFEANTVQLTIHCQGGEFLVFKAE